MADFRGKFVWYELLTTDPAGAETFYKSVVGWGARDSGMAGPDYTLLTVADAPVAGLMTLPEEARSAGSRPGWLGYIAVDDVDATAANVAKAGGVVHRAPADIPEVGRFAVVADPQGAVFVPFKGGSEAPPEPAPATPGYAGWHELQASDLESAFSFYAGLFGWTKGEAVDMGPIGIYQIFNRGGVGVGGMMAKMPDVPRPFWLYYFNVDKIEAAASRVTAAGGKVLHGPMQVPGGSWILQGLDPQGALFALVGPGG